MLDVEGRSSNIRSLSLPLHSPKLISICRSTESFYKVPWYAVCRQKNYRESSDSWLQATPIFDYFDVNTRDGSKVEEPLPGKLRMRSSRGSSVNFRIESGTVEPIQGGNPLTREG